MAESDSDEDTFVTVGTPLPPFGEGEAIRKPVTIQDQTVKDERGRRRFHGAFTGGFSAGYFNTVGSKEGWTPSTFVSSRSKKAETVSHKPEDYMDESDMGEFGIAPRKVTTSDEFMSNYKENERKRKLASASTGVIPGLESIVQAILPARSSIGVKLLQKMGWKSGQGIGPKSKRKRKKEDNQNVGGTYMKVYSCAMGAGEESDDSMEDLPSDYTFAPKDTNPISFEPKDNIYGIGYSGIDPTTALLGTTSRHVSLFEPPAVSRHGKKGFVGQAFGVGAMEEDDDDIYAVDNMSKYDTVLGGEDSISKLHGWTAPGSRQAVTHASYIGKLLEGFTLSDKPLPAKKCYPPPQLPRDYKPVHHFKKPAYGDELSSQPKTIDASTRREMIGEKVELGSVFDLVSSEDKKKMEAFKPSPKTTVAPPTVKLPAVPSGSEQRGMLTNSGFKPFAKDPEKQKRYEDYLATAKHGEKYNFDEALSGMTEWEKEREKEEFIRAAQLYRPMTSMMASRFTRAKYDDQEKTVEIPADQMADKSDKAKAAELKMFGHLTRDEFEWHPDPLLCKRFNVPNPYPGSTIVGLRSTRKDKLSMLNFLSFPETPAPDKEEDTKPTPKPIEYVSLTKPGLTAVKKVNIFSKIDELQKPRTTAAVEGNPTRVRETVPADEAKSEPESKTPTNSSEETQKIEGIERPPMDLFKAIFQDSDDMSSSDEEGSPQAVQQQVEPAVQEPAVKMAKLDGSEQSGTPHSFDWPKGQRSVEIDDDIYGPSLPPADSKAMDEPISDVVQTYMSSELFIEKSTKDKHRNKTKSRKHKKEKKKKSKQKHKSKKKKKQKSKVGMSDSESDYEGSSEESSDERTSGIIERHLLDKIRQLPSGRRPTAADFM